MAPRSNRSVQKRGHAKAEFHIKVNRLKVGWETVGVGWCDVTTSKKRRIQSVGAIQIDYGWAPDRDLACAKASVRIALASAIQARRVLLGRLWHFAIACLYAVCAFALAAL